MNKLVLIAALALVGCGDRLSGNEGVTDVLLDKALNSCNNNGGLVLVTQGRYQDEYEDCGRRCARPTGKILSTGIAHCGNSAMFKLTVTAPK